MKKGLLIIMILGGLVAALGLSYPAPVTVGTGSAIAYFKKAAGEFALSAESLEGSLRSVRENDSASLLRARAALEECRLRYKKIEFFLEYFFPSASTVYNTPPKAEVEEPELEYAEASGLQVMESLLTGKDAAMQKPALLEQAGLVSRSAKDLGALLYDFQASDEQVLESLRIELIRVMTLGITGYDAPVLKSGIRESAAVLLSMDSVLRPYLAWGREAGKTGVTSGGGGLTAGEGAVMRTGQAAAVQGEGRRQADSVRWWLTRAEKMLKEGNDFDAFDRMAFLEEAALPLQEALGVWVRTMGWEYSTTGRIFNPAARNLFSPDAINRDAFPRGVGAAAVGRGQSVSQSIGKSDGQSAGKEGGQDAESGGKEGESGDRSDGDSRQGRLVELGKRLFFEKALSGNYTRNCASCHDPARCFTDGRTRSLAYDGHSLVRRNAPSLQYAAYQYNQFLDGRVVSLEDQVKSVMRSPSEMNADFDSVLVRLGSDTSYRALFTRAFPGEGKTGAGKTGVGEAGDGRGSMEKGGMKKGTMASGGKAGVEKSGKGIGGIEGIGLEGSRDVLRGIDEVAAALAAYVRSLAPFHSDFDRYMAGDRGAMTKAQVRGFNLFMGKAQCGTCHFAPLFNGLVPPLYNRSEFEVLGMVTGDDFNKPVADRDSGRYVLYPISFYVGAFRTPTVRNSELTAPYMHQGGFASLEKVIEFYDKGGGAGLGLDLPMQTLPAAPLHLSETEKQEIIDFLKALTDKDGRGG